AEPPATATPVNGAPPTLRFNPAGRCPVYQVPAEIAQEVAARTHNDETESVALVRRGTPVAPVRTGTDGGMHPVFLATLNPTVVRDSEGNVRTIVETRAPGTVPATVNPPREADTTTGSVVAGTTPARPASGGYGLAGSETRPASTPAAPAGRQVAPQSGGSFAWLFSSDKDPPERARAAQP